MIGRDDFDAANFPEMRRELTAAGSVLDASIESVWSRERLRAWSSTLVARDCPVCGGDTTSAEVIVTKHGLDVVRCVQCAMVYTAAVSRDPAGLLTFTDQQAATSFVHRLQQPVHQQLSRRKYEYFLQVAGEHCVPGTLLDIGCCTGDFLDVARTLGWRASGLEASDTFARIARSRGFTVQEGVFPVTVRPAPGDAHNAISMLDVLEHLEDPVGALRLLRPHLDDGGVLIVQVPNFDSPLMRLEGASNRNYTFSHWSHFTHQTLAMTAERAGFRVRRLETVITERDRMLAYPRELVERAIRAIVGEGEAIPPVIDAQWLHDHFLGFKLFGLFSPA